jgi:predicted amidohydrolase
MKLLPLFRAAVFAAATSLGVRAAPDHAPAGWTTAAPREEISARFAYDATAGRDRQGAFVITTDTRDYLVGRWTKTFPVTGGAHYRFEAFHREQNVASPRRSVLARIVWRDARGRSVEQDGPAITEYLSNWGGTGMATAEPEHPADGVTGADGWTPTMSVYRAPAKATQAVVELHLQWEPNARVEWSQVSFNEAAAPAPRKVRLASVYFRPNGSKTARENLEKCVPIVEEAARGKADLVVLGEHIQSQGIKPGHQMAEPMPGPSSEFLGALAQKHNLYIVAGLIERDGARIYATAVLMGPDGRMVGKFRKTTLTDGEIASGMTPGHEYPVFQTRFGKVGMMICYDVFVPEPARQLALNGAEIIALPVYGCNELLAAARACENQVYLVTSIFSAPPQKWGVSAVYDYEGKRIAHAPASKEGSVAIAEVDLNKRVYWTSIGDMRSALPRHRPVVNESAPLASAVTIGR